MSDVRNLDSGMHEHFDFIVMGHTYRFRYPTMSEAEKLQAAGDDPKKTMEFMFQFIEKIEDKSPEFSKIAEKMTIPYWRKFTEMIKEEFSANE